MQLNDKDELEQFLRKNTALNIYQIGDLDNFYWNNTAWYGLKENNSLKSVVLLYQAPPFKVLLALAPEDETGYLKRLLMSLSADLPGKFYAHLSPGIEKIFETEYDLESHGKYQKMFLTDSDRLSHFESNDIVHLNNKDLNDIFNLYKESYPENSFDPRMIETGMYYGLKINNKLVCISGIHVYSEVYKVAALGNITTHPDYRGKGYGQRVTAHLCRVLLTKVNAIGLNVGQDNIPAIKCYRNLGFTKAAPYLEYMIRKKK
jgi:GNAT superfamily N-acetyltransferase